MYVKTFFSLCRKFKFFVLIYFRIWGTFIRHLTTESTSILCLRYIFQTLKHLWISFLSYDLETASWERFSGNPWHFTFPIFLNIYLCNSKLKANISLLLHFVSQGFEKLVNLFLRCTFRFTKLQNGLLCFCPIYDLRYNILLQRRNKLSFALCILKMKSTLHETRWCKHNLRLCYFSLWGIV